MTLARPLLLVALLLAAGCSTFDPQHLDRGLEFRALGKLWPEKRPVRVLLLLPEDLRAPEAEPREGTGRMDLDAHRLQSEVRRALGEVLKDGVESVEVARGDQTVQQAIETAYTAGRVTLVVRARVERWNARFLDTNGYWYPNAGFVALFFFPVGPQWLIGDELFGVDCEVVLDVLGVASERPLPKLSGLRLRLKSTPPPEDAPDTSLRLLQDPSQVVAPPWMALDDLDRGLDVFGTWFPGDLSADQWNNVGRILEPYARRAAAVRIAAAVAAGLRDTTSGEQEEHLASPHALVIGAASGSPACEGADRDATAMTELLRGRLAALSPEGRKAEHGKRFSLTTPAKNLATLINEQATRATVLAQLERIQGRALARDTVVLYFAGRGTRGPGKGAESFLLQLGSKGETISLAALGAALRKIPARRRVVVIDADFAPGPRGGPGKRSAAPLAGLLRDALLKGAAEGGVILASQLRPDERVQTYEGQGLLTRFLIRGLRGHADQGRDGLTWQDLSGYLDLYMKNVSTVALEHPQRPLVVTVDARREVK